MCIQNNFYTAFSSLVDVHLSMLDDFTAFEDNKREKKKNAWRGNTNSLLREVSFLKLTFTGLFLTSDDSRRPRRLLILYNIQKCTFKSGLSYELTTAA